MKQWNPKAEDVSELSPEHSHSAVRKTSYMEVHKLLGTSGCSNDGNQWMWNRLGVMETKRGKLVVNPGDWIAELSNGEALIVPKLEDDKFLMEIGKDDLVNLIAGYQLSYKQKELPLIKDLLDFRNDHVLDWDRTTLNFQSISELVEVHQLLWSTEQSRTNEL